jgi:hypothetical protein
MNRTAGRIETRIDDDQCARGRGSVGFFMWQPISSAPFDRDLELAVIDADGEHVLAFPAKRVAGGWTDATNKRRIDVWPTHWREWASQPR